MGTVGCNPKSRWNPVESGMVVWARHSRWRVWFFSSSWSESYSRARKTKWPWQTCTSQWFSSPCWLLQPWPLAWSWDMMCKADGKAPAFGQSCTWFSTFRGWCATLSSNPWQRWGCISWLWWPSITSSAWVVTSWAWDMEGVTTGVVWMDVARSPRSSWMSSTSSTRPWRRGNSRTIFRTGSWPSIASPYGSPSWSSGWCSSPTGSTPSARTCSKCRSWPGASPPAWRDSSTQEPPASWWCCPRCGSSLSPRACWIHFQSHCANPKIPKLPNWLRPRRPVWIRLGH